MAGLSLEELAEVRKVVEQSISTDQPAGPGRIVQWGDKYGRTYNSDGLINGKLPVYSGATKTLVSLDKIKWIGFID